MRREVKILRSSRPVVSESPTIKRALAQVEQVAPTPATVLLLGETGAGKEVFAQAIHDLSPRHPSPHGPGQLRGDSARAHRERAVRPRARRLHRRAVAPDRAIRSRQPVDALPRRDRRAAAGSAGEAPARAAGTRHRAAWQHAADQDRRPDHRRHQPQPRAGGDRRDASARICSTGSTCFRSSCRRCASASRTSPGSCGRSSTSSRGCSASDRVGLEGQPARAAGLLVAGQRPRAAQRDRARRDSRRPARISPCKRRSRQCAPRRPPRRSRRSRSATSAACSRARTGASAAAAAPPNVSASSRPRSRAGWRGSASRARRLVATRNYNRSGF